MRYIFEKFALGLCCIAGAVLLFLLIQHLAHHSLQMAKKTRELETVRIEKDKEAKNAKDNENIYEDEETETVRIEKHLHQSQQSMAKKKFAQDLVASVPGIINAWWSQDISLWVEIDITTFVSNPKLYAQQIADKLSWAASKKFGYVCVHVYYGKQRQLAKSCG